MPFDSKRAIKPVTLHNYLTRLRVYATTLVAGGMPLSGFTSLSSLVDEKTVKWGLEQRLGDRHLADPKVAHDLNTIMVALLSVARFLPADAANTAELQRLTRVRTHFAASQMRIAASLRAARKLSGERS